MTTYKCPNCGTEGIHGDEQSHVERFERHIQQRGPFIRQPLGGSPSAVKDQEPRSMGWTCPYCGLRYDRSPSGPAGPSCIDVHLPHWTKDECQKLCGYPPPDGYACFVTPLPTGQRPQGQPIRTFGVSIRQGYAVVSLPADLYGQFDAKDQLRLAEQFLQSWGDWERKRLPRRGSI